MQLKYEPEMNLLFIFHKFFTIIFLFTQQTAFYKQKLLNYMTKGYINSKLSSFQGIKSREST